MRINRDSRGWVVVCFLIMGAAVAFYVPYAQNSQKSGGPSGGSWYGLIYGSVGSAMMLFALLLGLKKRVRTMRIGRAYWWLQGHVWFGLIAYPIILLHAGFRWGGIYTEVLMWLFTIVVVSGIIGIIIQQLMPQKLLKEVQYETIYEQVEHVVEQLQLEADTIVQAAIGETGGEGYETEVVPAGAAVATAAQTNVKAAKDFLEFYSTEVKPYLNRRIPPATKFTSELAAQVVFDHVRTGLPKSLQTPLADLAEIVEERRQLAQQKKMHHVLHGWLIVHVPLSYALMILAAVHAVQALRYKWPPHW